MLDETANEIRAIGDDQRLRVLLAEVCSITRMGFAAIARVTDTRWIACQVLDRIDFGLNPGDELELKTTICSEIRELGEAVVIDHVATDDEWQTHATPIMYGFQSYTSFPIMVDGRHFFGTLCAIDPEPRPAINTESIKSQMEGFADRAAQILGERLSKGLV